MGRNDPELKGLIEKVGQLIANTLEKVMDGEEVQKRLAEIKHEMLENHGCTLLGIGVGLIIEVVTRGVEGAGKETVKVNFEFGESPEDKEWGKYLGLSPKDFEEMGQIAKGARPGEEREKNSSEPLAPPETSPSDLSPDDPRNTGQIIGSLREAARACSLPVREIFAENFQRQEWATGIGFPKAEQLGHDKIWLRLIQELTNRIQKMPPPLDRIVLLRMEHLFLRWSRRGI